jgi:WD40 repeat protein
VSALAFTPDGGTLLSGGYDKIVRLYDVSDSAHPRRLAHPIVTDDSVEALAVDPNRNGHVLATGGADDLIRLWDIADPADPRPIGGPLRGHSSSVDAVAIAPSGRLLASGSNDHTVRLWDITDPTRPIAIGQPLTGHEAMVDSVAFSADGRTLATGGQEASAGESVVLLWDVSVPGRPRRLPGSPVGNVSPVAFAADHHLLLTGSPQDGPVLWDLSGADAVRRDPMGAACSRAGGARGRDAWAAQVPDLPYEDACPG